MIRVFDLGPPPLTFARACAPARRLFVFGKCCPLRFREMLPPLAVPPFGWNGGPFPDYDGEAKVRFKVTHSDACRCAPTLGLRMDSSARDVCMAIGNNKPPERLHAADPTLRTVLRDYFATDAARQDAIRFQRLRETAQTTDDYVAKFDPPGRGAEGRTEHGGADPDEVVAVLRFRNAKLSPRDKSLALASTRGNSAMREIARRTLRLSDPTGASSERSVGSVGDSCAGGSHSVGPVNLGSRKKRRAQIKR